MQYKILKIGAHYGCLETQVNHLYLNYIIYLIHMFFHTDTIHVN